MLDLLERKKDESERLITAIAQGVAIAMSPEYAAQWLSERHHGPVPIAGAILGQMVAQFPKSFKVTRTN